LVLKKTLTNIVQISILIPVKKVILKEKQKDIKPKEKETEISSQILFSYPSDLPNGFSLISSRREVKSKTKINRVHWCVVRSVLIGEFQDLPLSLVVNPAPRRPISAFRGL
jgi:hypothetical protein